MTWCVRIVSILAVCTVGVVASGRQPPAKPRAKIEFKWVESKPIKGVTEEKGIRMSCGDELSYVHLTPVLTGANVAEAKLRKHDFTANNIGIVYDVQLHLTKDSRKKLSETAGDVKLKLLAIMVDGKYQGATVFYPERPNDFLPTPGYFSSQAEADRVVEACAPATTP